MDTKTSLFEITCEDDTVIVTPLEDLGEFGYQQIVDEAECALEVLEKSAVKKNVVVDFHKTDYFGSTALGLLVKLWKRVRSRDGDMAFCGLSDHEMEILKTTKLDMLWAICTSRQDALEAVRK